MNTKIKETISQIVDEKYLKMEDKFKKNKHIKLMLGGDSEIFKLVVAYPSAYIEDYQEEVDKKSMNFNVKKKLNFLKLSDYKYRTKISNEVKKVANLLYDMCTNQESNPQSYEEIKLILSNSDLKNQAKEKIILLEFARICKVNNIYDWTEKLIHIDNVISKSVFRNILNEVALQRGYKKGKDVGMKVDDIKDQIESVLDEESSDNTKELKRQNENLKSALIFINGELENYKKDLEKFKDEIELEVISEFIQVLNSDKYGRLLDNFVKCQKSLKELKRSKYQFPIQVESIPILIKQYMKFIQEYGIKEIEKRPMITITFEEASKGNYLGSPFETQDEVKKVKVESPGWIYKNMVISTPVYQEIEE